MFDASFVPLFGYYCSSYLYLWTVLNFVLKMMNHKWTIMLFSRGRTSYWRWWIINGQLCQHNRIRHFLSHITKFGYNYIPNKCKRRLLTLLTNTSYGSTRFYFVESCDFVKRKMCYFDKYMSKMVAIFFYCC